MKFTFVLLLVFIAPQMANAKDISQCQFSFHAIDSNGTIASKPYLTPAEIAFTEKRYSRPLKKDIIYMKFTVEGAVINTNYTSSNIGNYFAVFCNDTLFSKPRILEPTNDEAVFTLD